MDNKVNNGLDNQPKNDSSLHNLENIKSSQTNGAPRSLITKADTNLKTKNSAPNNTSPKASYSNIPKADNKLNSEISKSPKNFESPAKNNPFIDNEKQSKSNQNLNSNIKKPQKNLLQTDSETNQSSLNKKNFNKNSNNSSKNKKTDLNPSRKMPSKKYSKHADSDDDTFQEKTKEKRQPLRNNSLINKIIGSKQDSDYDESESNEEQTGTETLNGLAKGAKKIFSFVATLLQAVPILSTIGIILLVIIIVCFILLPILSSLSLFGQNDDGTVCYATAPCTTVILKTDDGDKSYTLDEYMAGAIVNYYDYSTIAQKNLNGSFIDDELLKALAVVVHTDISIYSDYDSTNKTCTINDLTRFKTIYEPPIEDNDNEENENVDTDDASGENSENTSLTEEEKQKLDYYNQAKRDSEAVINEVVNIYNSKMDIFYDNYIEILHNAIDDGRVYKDIVKRYIKNSPDYEKINIGGTDDESDNNVNENKDDVGVYPICYFDNSTSNDDGTNFISIAGDFCTQVKVTDKSGNLKGVYPFEDFIEGVVYHEARAWYQSSDTMKAHAVAARTWLYNAVKTNYHASIDGNTCTIEISGDTLGFTENTIPAIHQAVTETAGEYIIVNGKISTEGRWDALAIRDGYYQNKDSKYYTLAQKNQKIPKDWLDKQPKFMTIPEYITASHGAGMSQYGAYYLATVENKNYKEIINYYYGADISKVSNGYVMPINTFSMITGELSVGYCESRTYHSGLDFAAPSGTPVYAATSGVIEKEYSYTYQCLPETYKDGSKNPHYYDCVKGYNSNYSDNSAGQGFKIKNDDGTYSVYFHFSKKENLHKGDRVVAGQKIGEVGTTGKSTGNHLHYEMRPSSTGKPLEPRDYLPMEGYEICHNNPNFRR